MTPDLAQRPEPKTSSGRRATDEIHDVLPLREATRTWFAISLQTFGGPAGQIAVMQRTLVDEKRWIGQRRFLHALNYCMLLPGPGGPAARDLRRAGCSTAFAAASSPASCSCCPGMLALLALSAIYVGFGDTDRRRRRSSSGSRRPSSRS